jgi:hypothetical protein
MFGYTLRKRPIHIFAETTQNVGWIRPQFVVYNNTVAGLRARLHTELCHYSQEGTTSTGVSVSVHR